MNFVQSKTMMILIIVMTIAAVQAITADESTIIEVASHIPSTADHYYRYLIASYHHASGNNATSMATFHQLFKCMPSPYACYDYLQLLFNTGQYQKIAHLYNHKKKELDEAFQSNASIQLILAQTFLATNQEKKSEEIFAQLINSYPNDPQIAYLATTAYMKNNQFEKAHELIDRCLKNSALKQKAFLFYFLQSKAFIEQKKNQEALQAIEKSLNLFPKFDRGWLFKAVLLEQMGKINDAITGYKEFLGLIGHNPMIERQIVQLLFAQQRFEEAHNFLEGTRNNSPDHFFEQALTSYNKKNMDQALHYIEKVLSKEPNFTNALLLKIEIFLQQKKIHELLSFMKSWVESTHDDITVFNTLLLLRKTGVQHSDLIKLLQTIEKTKPHIYVFASLADLFLEKNDHTKALAYYNKVLTSTNNVDILAKTRFQMSYVYFISKQVKKLEKTLTEAVSFPHVYPSTYNLLAYHYAQQNKKLPEALEYIDKALVIAPNCHYYIDTKGYILYKLGRYNDATEQFKQALALAPSDNVIKEHLKISEQKLGTP